MTYVLQHGDQQLAGIVQIDPSWGNFRPQWMVYFGVKYFERCFPHGDQFCSHRIEQLCTSGDEAFVRYLAETRDGSRFRNTEYIRTDGHKIREVDVFFGGAPSIPAEGKV